VMRAAAATGLGHGHQSRSVFAHEKLLIGQVSGERAAGCRCPRRWRQRGVGRVSPLRAVMVKPDAWVDNRGGQRTARPTTAQRFGMFQSPGALSGGSPCGGVNTNRYPFVKILQAAWFHVSQMSDAPLAVTQNSVDFPLLSSGDVV